MNVKLEFIDTASPLHPGELDLRYRVLREPLGMPRGSEVYAYEDGCLHLVALEGAGTVVGCVMFQAGQPEEDKVGGRLLQMAVDDSAQGLGVGRKLVATLEQCLLAAGFNAVELHAREVAFGFYERLGYEFCSEPYTEVGLPHRNMSKRLA